MLFIYRVIQKSLCTHALGSARDPLPTLLVLTGAQGSLNHPVRLKCSETKKWRETCFSSKWLNVNEDVACRRIINFTNVPELRSTGKYLYKIRCKWKNEISNTLLESYM
jgi:hypothetical protein